jgi:hypothetical protein
MATAFDKGGAHNRGVLKHLVGTDWDVVIEVGAVAREFQD